ncbi:MAG: ATP-binding protein [Candidatus Hadarchaeota archaeon]
MDKRKLEEFNEWWFTNKVPAELLQPFKRGLFKDLLNHLKRRQALAITGLRRVGKTTLMYQLIQHLLESGVEPTSILFFSFDEAAGQLGDAIETYREIYNRDLRGGRTYVFLDEVQKLGGWADQLKKYYDLYPQVKFVVSGSESLFVMKGSRERLAGRMYEFFLPTLSFGEFLKFNGVETRLPELKRRQLFRRYVEHGGFPETALETNLNEIRRYVRASVIDRLVFKDIITISGARDAALFMSMLEIFAENPGMQLEYQSLAQQLGRDRRVVRNYTEWLRDGFLVSLLANFRKGKVASVRKLKRVYLADTSIITAFHGPAEDSFFGRMVENAVINATSARFFWRNRHDVDAVANGVPIEVKYQPKILSGDLKGIREFMRKFGVSEGLVVTKDEEREMKLAEGLVRFVPADIFLASKMRSSILGPSKGSIAHAGGG